MPSLLLYELCQIGTESHVTPSGTLILSTKANPIHSANLNLFVFSTIELTFIIISVII